MHQQLQERIKKYQEELKTLQETKEKLIDALKTTDKRAIETLAVIKELQSIVSDLRQQDQHRPQTTQNDHPSKAS